MKSNINIIEIKACEDILRAHGGRVTSGRVALLVLLRLSKKPLSISDIKNAINYKLDIVSLYRGLDFLVLNKLVSKINLHNNLTYFEYIYKSHHHHHIICESCGLVEDVQGCKEVKLQTKVASSSKNFNIINKHSLEFFGMCHACAK